MAVSIGIAAFEGCWDFLLFCGFQGCFDVIVVHKLDRFSRDRYDSAFYMRELRKNGVQL